MIEYRLLSVKISKFYKSDSDSFINNPILTALLLARKRIIHKAFNKLEAFRNILREQFVIRGHLKYTLVYVPEGNNPNDFFDIDFLPTTDEAENDNVDEN